MEKCKSTWKKVKMGSFGKIQEYKDSRIQGYMEKIRNLKLEIRNKNWKLASFGFLTGFTG